MSHTDPQHPPSGDRPASSPASGPTPYEDGARYGGSTAYPSPSQGHPGPGWPSDPPPAGPSGPAVAALVVGAVSLLLCLVPVVNAVSVLGGIAAVVLGVVALRRLAPGGPGKGFAVAGIVLGAVSAVVAVAMWVLITLAVAGFEGGDVETVLEEPAAVGQSGPGPSGAQQPRL